MSFYAGVVSYTDNIKVIIEITESDHMDEKTGASSQQKYFSWDGCILFIEQCSVIASKLFQLIVGPMGQRWKKGKKSMTKRPVTAEDWTDDCRQALRCLKQDSFLPVSHFRSPSQNIQHIS